MARRPEYDSQVPDPPRGNRPEYGSQVPSSSSGRPDNQTGNRPYDVAANRPTSNWEPAGGGFPEWGPGTIVDDVLDDHRGAGRNPAGTDSTNTSGGSYYSRGGGGGYGGGGGGGGGGTSTSRQVNLTNPETARALLNNTLTQLLGREATPNELSTFVASLNKTERKSPTITKSTVAGTEATTVTKGGTDPAELAKQFAQSRSDYSEYQGATTFLDAFIEGIRNPGRLI